ncbi:MAG: carbamoyl-phosphate synthase large subunit, partial [Ilumatobacteraceae bacterium]
AESLQKALRSLENGRLGLNCDPGEEILARLSEAELIAAISIPTPERLFQVGDCLRRGLDTETIHLASHIDPWFIDQMRLIIDEREHLATIGFTAMTRANWRRAKRLGFSDGQLAYLWGVTESLVRQNRINAGVVPTYKTVDTCSAEFEAETPYHYSTYEDENEVKPSSKPRVIILGSGPNRIGQGIEFDYCCVHASFALRDAGFETVMINCNPETVSTDYDTSDRLYFEPLTAEDVMNVIEAETIAGGAPPRVVVSLGGQTPLKLSGALPPHLIAGTSAHSIDVAEDRQKWSALCQQLEITQPPGGTALTVEEAIAVSRRVGYPVLIRPSYVLGGRAMQIVHDDEHLMRAMSELATAGTLGREGGLSAQRPVLVDRFLEDATEIDVDAIRDATGDVLIGGVMEHVEEAGVHSGDSACAIPPPTLESWAIESVESYTKAIANALDVRGLLNVQFALAGNTIYVLEANPRASRTVPFVAKATGVPLAKIASRVMLGATLVELRKEGLLKDPVNRGHVSVKEAVLPFNRFPQVDTTLGPEMRSTGEVMGIDSTFGRAFVKAETAAGTELPTSGMVFLTLNDRDKASAPIIAKGLRQLGLGLVATSGTAEYLAKFGYSVDRIVGKVSEQVLGSESQWHNDAVELLKRGEISFVINTPSGGRTRTDGEAIRKAANMYKVSSVTTIKAALAAVQGLAEAQQHPLEVRSLQEYHGR